MFWFAAILAVAFVATPVFASGAYSITVKTNSATYSGTQPIVITGAVSPPPGNSTGVVITIRNSANAIADVNEVPDQTNGSFSWTSYPGANSNWIAGTFSVNATWGSGSGSASAVSTFTYSPSAATSTTTNSSSTSSTTGTTTSASSSSSSSSSSSGTSSRSSSSSSTTTPASSSSSASVVTVTVTSAPTTSTSSTTSSPTVPKVSGGGISLGSLTYPIVAVVVIVLAAVGLMMWRRKVASDYEAQSATKR